MFNRNSNFFPRNLQAYQNFKKINKLINKYNRTNQIIFAVKNCNNLNF